MWNNDPLRELPYPTDMCNSNNRVDNPMDYPPQTPIKGPPAVQGMERNILGVVIDYIQSMVGKSGLRNFAYNALSENGYRNESFVPIFEVILYATAAMIERGDYPRGQQAARVASQIMVDFALIGMAEKFPVLQELDPELGQKQYQIKDAANSIRVMAGEYKRHVEAQYQSNHQYHQNDPWSQQSTDYHQPPVGSPWGGAGNPTDARFPDQTPHVSGADIMFGGSPAPNNNSQPYTESNMSNEDFDNPLLAAAFSNQAQESAPQESAASRETTAAQAWGSDTTEVPDEGRTVVNRSDCAATEDGKGGVWLVPKEGAYLERDWSMSQPHPLLFDVDTYRLAYHQRTVDGKPVIMEVVTERSEKMGAGYHLHELAYTNKDAFLDTVEEQPTRSINDVYERPKLLKDDISYEQLVSHFNIHRIAIDDGKIDPLVFMTMERARRDQNKPHDTVVVMDYREKFHFVWDIEIKAVIEDLCQAGDLLTLHTKLTDDKSDIPAPLLTILERIITTQVNRVLNMDFNLVPAITVESFVGDAEELVDYLGKTYSARFSQSIQQRVMRWLNDSLRKIEVRAPDEEGDNPEVIITRLHQIVDIPLTTEALRIGGSEKGRGAIAMDTHPVLYHLITTAINQTDCFMWLRTFDGTLMEVRPSPLLSGQWIINEVERIG